MTSAALGKPLIAAVVLGTLPVPLVPPKGFGNQEETEGKLAVENGGW